MTVWTPAPSVCPACQLPVGSHLAPGGSNLCQGHAKSIIPCWQGFGSAGETGATCGVRICQGEQALWKSCTRREPVQFVRTFRWDSLSHLPPKGEVDAMEHLVFVFLVLLFMQVREICLKIEGKFGEGLRSLKMFNPQAEGFGQMCSILSAETS